MRWTLSWAFLGLALGLALVLLLSLPGQEVTGCADGPANTSCQTYTIRERPTAFALAAGGLVGGLAAGTLAAPFRHRQQSEG
jgi:hypothetical protein